MSNYVSVCSSITQIHSLQNQLEFQEQSMVEKSLVCRQEAKIRELETKLDYERTQIKRLEVRCSSVSPKLRKKVLLEPVISNLTCIYIHTQFAPEKQCS